MKKFLIAVTALIVADCFLISEFLMEPSVVMGVIACLSTFSLMFFGFAGFLILGAAGVADTQEDRVARLQRMSGIAPPPAEPDDAHYCLRCLMPMATHKHGVAGELLCPDLGS